ncbi:MAG: DUF262 domain-containing protein [Gammaproteobacteria bacterium]
MAEEVRESFGNGGGAADASWVDEGDAIVENEPGSEEYDITASPNDFNVMTLNHIVGSGAVKMPGFQRNFVWDIQRASKLVESIILRLPIPQLFLYEEKRNKFLVIDGQQRLMSIYFFAKGRFPRPGGRAMLRPFLTGGGKIPDEILQDNNHFQPFKLRLPEMVSGQKNRFAGLTYEVLDDYQASFDMRPLRSVVIRQNSSSDSDSSIYEIFNRLNTGGVNLRPQEIRTCMYYSAFYDMLDSINADLEWRRILGKKEADKNMKDIEILLRGFAMLANSENYAPSMIRFLNEFSHEGTKYSSERNEYLRALFQSFLRACAKLPDGAFLSGGRFSVALYEAVFSTVCKKAHTENRFVENALESQRVEKLARDQEFVEASQQGTAQQAKVQKRLARAREIVGAL